MAFRIAQMPMTLSVFEDHFCCYKWQTRRVVPLHLQSFWFCAAAKFKTHAARLACRRAALNKAPQHCRVWLTGVGPHTQLGSDRGGSLGWRPWWWWCPRPSPVFCCPSGAAAASSPSTPLLCPPCCVYGHPRWNVTRDHPRHRTMKRGHCCWRISETGPCLGVTDILADRECPDLLTLPSPTTACCDLGGSGPTGHRSGAVSRPEIRSTL